MIKKLINSMIKKLVCFICRPMVIVFFALLASLICEPAAESEYISSMIERHGYIFYSLLWAGIYIFPSAIFAYISHKMLDSGRNLEVTLIAMLSLCMAVSALLCLIMTNKESYYALLGLKSGWSGLYSAVEVLIACIVGGNGLNYLANGDGGRSDTGIFDGDYHWTGKFK